MCVGLGEEGGGGLGEGGGIPRFEVCNVPKGTVGLEKVFGSCAAVEEGVRYRSEKLLMVGEKVFFAAVYYTAS